MLAMEIDARPVLFLLALTILPGYLGNTRHATNKLGALGEKPRLCRFFYPDYSRALLDLLRSSKRQILHHRSGG